MILNSYKFYGILNSFASRTENLCACEEWKNFKYFPLFLKTNRSLHPFEGQIFIKNIFEIGGKWKGLYEPIINNLQILTFIDKFHGTFLIFNLRNKSNAACNDRCRDVRSATVWDQPLLAELEIIRG